MTKKATARRKPKCVIVRDYDGSKDCNHKWIEVMYEGECAYEGEGISAKNLAKLLNRLGVFASLETNEDRRWNKIHHDD